MKRSLPVLAVATLLLSLAIPQSMATAAPQACKYPADVLDLGNWKETLPTGSAGSPTEITQPKLATYSQDPWFTANSACDGVRFRAAVNGTTTSGSSYPRSELREMTDNGSSTASWSTTSGTHTMTIDEAITHLPNDKPQVVAGQIHDADDDVTVFRLEDGKLYVTDGDNSTYKLADGDYKLGTRFTAKFVAADGKIQAYYNDTLVATLSAKSSGDYFKAGAYTQANCDKSKPCADTNYGEVVVYKLAVSHQN